MKELTKKEEEKLLRSLKEGESIEKEVSISWDGINLFLRLPKEIATFLGVNKDNRFERNMKFIVKES